MTNNFVSKLTRYIPSSFLSNSVLFCSLNYFGTTISIIIIHKIKSYFKCDRNIIYKHCGRECAK